MMDIKSYTENVFDFLGSDIFFEIRWAIKNKRHSSSQFEDQGLFYTLYFR